MDDDASTIGSAFVDTPAGRVHALTAGTGDPLVLLPHGGKLGAAIAARHPESLTGFVFAGLTHSIVLGIAARAVTLGDHPTVRALLGAEACGDAWRRAFTRAVLAFDLESALRDALALR
ncbi:hypothetical protein [Agromyces aerolatus]|uniref:hypothetical protein n=1 Tax=Agromyces sp. LY-1074 TaxID=3074080 RepID=UPI00285DC6D0|nr:MULTISPECIES: hypothetical protein [unclassified Agromyces]MDR5701581.1 hypothetical protein [Agromyces sp. LY-1074]MDR5706111.1 hypothetical protein [Agromyces sp. LY-1358]